MADKTEFLQAIDDAILDADSLEQFINGSEEETVLTRLSAEYPTLQKAIKELFESGGIADRFNTLADLQASGLVDGDYALVADDAEDKNGIYIKEAGAWVKSSYDPFGYANILARKLREENAGIINHEWERGSLSGTDGGKYDSPSYLNRVRLKEARTLAPNTQVTVTSSDPDVGVAMVYWDKDNNFTHLFNYYTQERTVVVPYEYSVVARYNDLREFEDIDEITSKIKISHVSQNDMKVESFGEAIETLNDIVLRGRYVPKWKIGSYKAGGGDYYQNNRLRFATGKVPYKGEVIVETTNPLQSVRVVTFKEDGSFIGYNNLAKKHEVLVDGYFDVLVAWDDNAPIFPQDAGVEITIGRGGSGSGSESDSSVFDPSGMPRFSEVPFGHLLGETLPVLQTSFDNLVAGYHGTTTKTSIGFSTSGGHEMFAYELTPPDYVITIAITMHTHGNERWNPLGFYALLNEMQRGGNKHELIKWLKENVRWLVVPFASPTGVEKNIRIYDGADPNRNYDHLWDLWPSEKGTAVYSLKETQNIAGYFKPLRKEIDYHLDLHDIPTGLQNYAYMPFGPPQTAYKKEKDTVKAYLGKINNAPFGGDYVMDGGSTTNFFSSVLAVPSISPEHITHYWVKRGFTPDQQIAKALEQTCGFLYLFRYFHQQEDLRNSSYYSDKYEVAYSSKEFGIHSWSKAQLYTAILGTGLLTEDATQSNVFLNTGVVDAPTILVLSGSTEDDNNSDLTVLRVLQNIQGGDKMFINHLKNSNLVIAPAINANVPTAETVSDHVSTLVAKYNPDYTVLVTAAGFEDAVGITTASSDEEASFTSMTKKSGVELTTEESALSDSLVGRYTIFSLQNEVVRHAAYPHTVAKWVGLVANDLASYFSGIINN